MSHVGNYLYGFTPAGFRPATHLRGLAGAPVRVIGFGEIAAVVSSHPVQPLLPSRSNLEPHHRVVRNVSCEATLVPAAFGHITDSDADLVGVLRTNYDEIRDEIARLDGKCEVSVKLFWNVPNIFEYLVRTNRELRALRDRMFKNGDPSTAGKLEVGAMFEATLARERERLTRTLLTALDAVTCDVVMGTPRDETHVCDAALLIECARAHAFGDALRAAAGLFDSHFTVEYSGPWPAYSFVRLRLSAGVAVA
jgi:hypothetical protein